MIAKIRLLSNADQIDDAVQRFEEWANLDDDERKRTRKPKIPKPIYVYNPITIATDGIKIAYVAEDGAINMLHEKYSEWLALENEDGVWKECVAVTSGVKVEGFGQKKSQNT